MLFTELQRYIVPQQSPDNFYYKKRQETSLGNYNIISYFEISICRTGCSTIAQLINSHNRKRYPIKSIIFDQISYILFQCIWSKVVISINKRDIFPFYRFKSIISCTSSPPIFLMLYYNSIVCFRQFLQNP